MKIDTHTHLVLTKDAPPDWKSIKFYYEVARANCLDVVCFTEHLDATYYFELLDGIFYKNLLGGKILEEGIIELENSLIISAGAEVSLKGGGDVGLHVKPAILHSINKEKAYYTLSELVNTVSNLTNEYVIVAHHVYRPEKWIDGLEESGDLLDLIELPAKDIIQKEKYEHLSQRLKRPFAAGSDSHTWVQLGVGYTIIDNHLFKGGFFNIQDFKKIAKDGYVKTEISPEAGKFVYISNIYRKHLML